MVWIWLSPPFQLIGPSPESVPCGCQTRVWHKHHLLWGENYSWKLLPQGGRGSQVEQGGVWVLEGSWGLVKGFELVVWPRLKECSHTDHAHSCGWWEGAGGQPGGWRLLQHPAPTPPNPQQRLLHPTGPGTGGISSLLPFVTSSCRPRTPLSPGSWWPRVI